LLLLYLLLNSILLKYKFKILLGDNFAGDPVVFLGDSVGDTDFTDVVSSSLLESGDLDNAPLSARILTILSSLFLKALISIAEKIQKFIYL
jgi:hypothetical protein